CRRLPSDSTSRWTPLPLAMCLALSARTRDFHPLDCAHAGRTKANDLAMRFHHLVSKFQNTSKPPVNLTQITWADF
ncbi:MAG: hypothetical protein PHV03_11305, partial [Desulfitobacteriaceae bacterium]|nr:hypothetical protein [Desulfitobacteriaceae bacterium]MDD4402874.1 hypothetical protein [Desulfitobacteriaceae bacterium]